MIHQYYLGKINLRKLGDLDSHLKTLGNFTATKRNVRDPFIYQFDPNRWYDENKFEILIYNKKYNLFIETTNGSEELRENLKLIKRIMEIVETKEIFSGAGTSLEKMFKEIKSSID